jgi:hypothetical protein
MNEEKDWSNYGDGSNDSYWPGDEWKQVGEPSRDCDLPVDDDEEFLDEYDEEGLLKSSYKAYGFELSGKVYGDSEGMGWDSYNKRRFEDALDGAESRQIDLGCPEYDDVVGALMGCGPLSNLEISMIFDICEIRNVEILDLLETATSFTEDDVSLSGSRDRISKILRNKKYFFPMYCVN